MTAAHRQLAVVPIGRTSLRPATPPQVLARSKGAV
jgi:hypothetical protein